MVEIAWVCKMIGTQKLGNICFLLSAINWLLPPLALHEGLRLIVFKVETIQGFVFEDILKSGNYD